MGVSLPMISAGLGIAGSLSSMFGGSPTAPPMWNMPGRDQAAGGASAGIGQLPNYNTWNIPGASQVTQNLVNNPGAPGAQAGANVASNLGTGAALPQWAQGMSLYPYAQQVLQSGFDPQSALYDRTRQQVQDQVRASEAARGVQTTPYGAGVENKAMSDFNIDWQNQQLQRQISGGQAGSNMSSAGANIAGSAAPLFMQSAMYPYAIGQQIGSNQIGALSGMGQFGQNASQLTQQQVQDYLNYIGQGNNSQAVNNQTGNLAFNQNQTLGQNIGAGISQLGNAWSRMPGQSQTPTGWGQPQSVPWQNTGGGYGSGGVW